jgi:hypothetical protein
MFAILGHLLPSVMLELRNMSEVLSLLKLSGSTEDDRRYIIVSQNGVDECCLFFSCPHDYSKINEFSAPWWNMPK